MIDVLWISLIGAGLVFLGLVILWLLMDFLVRATSKKKREDNIGVHGGTSDLEKEDDLRYKQKAAAASVAVSIALLNTSFLSSRLKNKQGMSPWQIAHRNQQIYDRVESTFRDRHSK